MFNGIGSGIDNIKLSSVAVTLPCEVWKLLELGEFVDENNYWESSNYGKPTYLARQVQMKLVAKGVDPLEGENGYAPTTWRAQSIFYHVEYTNSDGSISSQNFPMSIESKNASVFWGWKESSIRLLLNGSFYAKAIPAELRPYLRRVIKYSTSFVLGNMNNAYPTIDWVWISSVKELEGGWADFKEAKGYCYSEYDTYWGNASDRRKLERGANPGVKYDNGATNMLNYNYYHARTAPAVNAWTWVDASGYGKTASGNNNIPNSQVGHDMCFCL